MTNPFGTIVCDTWPGEVRRMIGGGAAQGKAIDNGEDGRI